MPIEKVNLGLQVVTTVATIWLGYVGYELAKAQNQIAEVQTYGLPPTVNMRADFNYSNTRTKGFAEGTLKVQINNNHTYPITVQALRLDTQVDTRLDVLDWCYANKLDETEPTAIFTCSIDEIIEAGGVEFMDLPFSFPLSSNKVELDMLDEKPPRLDYYDPVLNKKTNTGGPTLPNNAMNVVFRSFDTLVTIPLVKADPEPEQLEPEPEQ